MDARAGERDRAQASYRTLELLRDYGGGEKNKNILFASSPSVAAALIAGYVSITALLRCPPRINTAREDLAPSIDKARLPGSIAY